MESWKLLDFPAGEDGKGKGHLGFIYCTFNDTRHVKWQPLTTVRIDYCTFIYIVAHRCFKLN